MGANLFGRPDQRTGKLETAPCRLVRPKADAGQNRRHMVEVRKDARAAGRGAIALVLVQSLSRVLLLAFIVAAARKVGPSDFGRYATVAALLVVTGFVADFGTTQATTKLVTSGSDSDSVLRDSLSACGLLGLFSYLVGIGLAAIIGHGESATIDFAVAGFSLPLDGLTTSLSGALDGRGLITQRAIVSLVRIGLGSIIGVVVVEWTGSIRFAMIGLAIGPAVALGVAVWITYRSGVWRLRANLNPWAGRDLLRRSIPFALISGASATLARVDVLVLSALSTSTQTADYNLALRAMEALQYPLWAMLGPTLFLFTRRLGSNDVEGAVRAFQVLAKAFFMISLPMAAGMAVVGHDVIDTVFGRAFSAAGSPLVILSAGLYLTYMVGLAGMFVSAYPSMRQVVTMIIIVDLTAIALQLPFIYRWGAIGAAIGLMIGQLMTMVVQVIFVRRTLGVWLSVLPPWRLVVAALACGSIAKVLLPVSMPLAVAGGVVTYVVLVAVTKGVTRAESRSFVSLVRR
jgi:O-antigen/teichoic acid export membrane protein